MTGGSPQAWLDPAPWSKEHADRLAAAKLWVVSPSLGGLPYLATAVYALITIPSLRVASMATDPRWRLYLNPQWLERAEVPDAGRHLVHQVWHLLADHAQRAAAMQVRAATAEAWRRAADLGVQQVVPWDDLSLPPPSASGLPSGKSSEEYFAMLSGLPVVPEDIEGERQQSERGSDGRPGLADASCGSGCDGIPRSFDAAADVDEGAVDPGHGEALRKEVAIAFREHSRRVGTMPGQWSRWVSDILDPVVPWQQVLHAAVRKGVGWGHGHTDYTYSRISRRQAAAGPVVLPALRRPVPSVAIVIDTSGSVDDGLLAQALGEVDGVLSSMAVGPQAVTTLAVDAAVQRVAQVRDARSVPLGGGGGTDMGVGIEAACALRPPAQLIVVLTDGYTPWPQHPPPVPVIVALLGRDRGELPPTPWWVQRVEVLPQR